MKVSVLGTGYVGLVTGVILSELGNDVICMDIDKEKVASMKKGNSPIYEPGLADLMKRNINEGRLNFTTSIKEASDFAEVIFIAVGTPTSEDGQADLQYVCQVAEDIGNNIKDYKVIVNKSTIPVGTNHKVRDIIKNLYQGDFDVVSNPEFLREGNAVKDCLEPDRIVIGHESEKAKDIMMDLYSTLDTEFLITDIKSAEMIKYASNAMLATEISYINDVAMLCEKIGADIEAVSMGMKLDKRIGKYAFLNAGIGYGGSCFPKDVKALMATARIHGIKLSILDAVEQINIRQKKLLYDRVEHRFDNKIKGKTFGIWGLAFKPHTDDLREAVSKVILKKLIDAGAKIRAFDPIAASNAKKEFPEVDYVDNPYAATKDVDALLIVTEWPEFGELDLSKIKDNMKTPIIFDGRNIYNRKDVEKLGFEYFGIGR